MVKMEQMGLVPPEESAVSDGIQLYQVHSILKPLRDLAVGEVVAVPMMELEVVVATLVEPGEPTTIIGVEAVVPTTQELNRSFLLGQMMDMER